MAAFFPHKRRNSRPLVAAVGFLIIVGLLTTGWILMKEVRVQQSVYARILDQKLTTTQTQFRLFLEPLSRHLDTLAGWQTTGMLDPDAAPDLRRLVLPLLSTTEQVSGLYFLRQDAAPVTLVRHGDDWVYEATAAFDSLTAEYLEEVSRRGESPEDYWSRYLTLPGTAESGLIVARRVGSLLIALGISEAQLDAFAATAPITENGFFIRRFTTGHVAWLTPRTGNRLDITDGGELLLSSRPEHVIIGRALNEWALRERPYHAPFQFTTQGQTWWCSFYPARTGTDPGELGLIAPASDLGERLETVTGRVTLLLAALLALAMTVVVAVAFDYRNKWRRFAQRRLQPPGDEAALTSLIAGGESDQLEFKSTMRWNLHADKAGKEIEMAWLKTVAGYLNTNGGFLVIGVSDDGTILGLEADKFPNEDKLILHFDNLIKQHIGLQHASFIRGAVRDLAGKRVFLIQCDRCDEPVYLTKGDEESFFIRIGASTRRLPISRINEYLKDRER